MLATWARLSGLTLVTTHNLREEILVYVHEVVNLSIGFSKITQDVSNLADNLDLICQTKRDSTCYYFVCSFHVSTFVSVIVSFHVCIIYYVLHFVNPYPAIFPEY